MSTISADSIVPKHVTSIKIGPCTVQDPTYDLNPVNKQYLDAYAFGSGAFTFTPPMRVDGNVTVSVDAITNGGVGVITAGAQTIAGDKTITGSLIVTNTTDADLALHGAVQVAGGVVVNKNALVNGYIVAKNLDDTYLNATWTGPCLLEGQAVVMSLAGETATLSYEFRTGTASAATYFTCNTFLPAIGTPYNQKWIPISVVDAGVRGIGILQLNTDGSANVYNGAVGLGNFTGTGVTGFGFDVSYALIVDYIL